MKNYDDLRETAKLPEIIANRFAIAAMGQIPIIGTWLQEIYDGIPGSVRQERVTSLLVDTADKVKELEVTLFKSQDDFNQVKDLLETLLDEAQFARSTSKRSYLINAFINIPLSIETLQLDKSELFLDILLRMPVVAIHRLQSKDVELSEDILDVLTNKMSTTDAYAGSDRILESFGLVEFEADRIVATQMKDVTPTFRARVTPLGYEFMEFLRDYHNNQA
ncbi:MULTISPECIES: hypothetical protein [Weissella]|uniref:hypothetical protein n=1 Tax=Weissella TaxID=46255 RepID=UPI000784B33E|nr:hypothetical protein [Weissella sp. DD23]KXU03074.1 hypothetical protein WEIDD23_01893 [Weissella sp. DD23]